MRWSAAMALAALWAAGCNNAAPSNDPFAPRLLPSTRVPPPATGAAAVGDGSYYNAPAPGPLPAPAPTGLPAASSGGVDTPANGPFRASPPGAGSFTPNQSSNAHGSTPSPSRSSGRMVDRSVIPASHFTGAASSHSADDEDEDDEDEEEDSDDAENADGLQPTSARMAKGAGSRGAVDIMDLPPVRR